MSILTEGLPDSLVISGQSCKIRTDMKTWLRFSELMAGSEEENRKNLPKMFKLVFDELPSNLFAAAAEMIQFYACGKIAGDKKGSGVPTKKAFDFEYDADLIYAAFLQQYNLDLVDSTLHWWKFRALLDSLSEETQFVKVVQYRSVNLSKIKDKEQRKFYRKMKELYRLPDNRSEAKKEEDFNRSFAAAFI